MENIPFIKGKPRIKKRCELCKKYTITNATKRICDQCRNRPKKKNTHNK